MHKKTQARQIPWKQRLGSSAEEEMYFTKGFLVVLLGN